MENLNTLKETFKLIDEKENICTYEQLCLYIHTYIKRLNKRELIFILCDNSIDTIMTYIGCIENKIVPVMLSGKIKDDDLEKLIRKYKPKYIWCKESRKNMLDNYSLEYAYNDYILLSRVEGYIVKLHDELALLLTTSGSTGDGKLVRISYKNIHANTLQIIDSLNIKSTDVTALVLPVNYTYALSIINTYYSKGGTILVFESPIYSGKIWRLMDKYKVTSFSGVPYTFEMLFKLRLTDYFPKSLKTITVAGGNLLISYQEKLYEFVKENNADFYLMYGQTEATARISCIKVERKEYLGTIGKVLAGEKYEISDDGELIIYGDNVSMGYALFAEDLFKGYENGNRLATNDIVEIDKNNNMVWKGRKDRVVKILGNRVDLNHLEEKLKTVYKGYNFICNKSKDDITLDDTTLKVEKENQEKIKINTNYTNPEEIREYIKRLTGFNKKIIIVNVVSEFKRKENGKIDYCKEFS